MSINYTQVSHYQKGETNLDFTETRDSEWQWHQLGHMQVCTSHQTDNNASTSPLSFFTGRMAFLSPNQQHQSTEGRCPLNFSKIRNAQWVGFWPADHMLDTPGVNNSGQWPLFLSLSKADLRSPSIALMTSISAFIQQSLSQIYVTMHNTYTALLGVIMHTLTALTLPELRHASRWHKTGFQPNITQL